MGVGAGECESSLSALLGGGTPSLPLINPEKRAKKGARYRSSGTLLVESVRLEERPSFVQFLRGGMEIRYAAPCGVGGRGGWMWRCGSCVWVGVEGGWPERTG